MAKDDSRSRYMIFEVESDMELKMGAMVSLLNKAGKNFNMVAPRLIEFNGYLGIVRFPHDKKEVVIRLLKSMSDLADFPLEVSTLRTSGTIKKLRQEFSLR